MSILSTYPIAFDVDPTTLLSLTKVPVKPEYVIVVSAFHVAADATDGPVQLLISPANVAPEVCDVSHTYA